MTKERLTVKLEELQRGYGEALANLNAYRGAIQVVESLLKEEEQAPKDEDVGN